MSSRSHRFAPLDAGSLGLDAPAQGVHQAHDPSTARAPLSSGGSCASRSPGDRTLSLVALTGPSAARTPVSSWIRKNRENSRASVASADLVRPPAGRTGRRHLEFLQHALAQPFGIALARLRKRNNLAGYRFLGNIVPVGEAKAHHRHFESEAHHADGLRLELMPFQERADRHPAASPAGLKGASDEAPAPAHVAQSTMT